MTHGTTKPVPYLTLTLAAVLCFSAVSATGAGAPLALASAQRPMLQPRDEQALAELLVSLHAAAKKLQKPAASTDCSPRRLLAESAGSSCQPLTFDGPPTSPQRGDYRPHLLNLPPPVKHG